MNNPYLTNYTLWALVTEQEDELINNFLDVYDNMGLRVCIYQHY